MIECIPNFSEGRRRDIIEALALTIVDVSGVAVLDTHIDADHNRSVITFAGAAEPIAEAAFRVVREAARLIDMTTHSGQHPRIGATDVLPFVPLQGATLEQCAELARQVGRRIGEELAIPVYLYGAAAMRSERRDLPNLRRGEYEGLRAAIERDPARKPDFGPARLGPAGAIAIGARPPLIAYNIFLNTSDVEIARRIAKAIRGSSGGLRGVRALGMLVGGRAQVSMNLTDYRATPIQRVFDMVKNEAAAYGTSVSNSELVGLIPADAMLDASRFYLRLHDLRDEQILERRLAQAFEPGIREVTQRGANTDQGFLASSHLLTTQVSMQSHADTVPESSLSSRLFADQQTAWEQSVAALATAIQELAALGIGEQWTWQFFPAYGVTMASNEMALNSLRSRIETLFTFAERAAEGITQVAETIDETFAPLRPPLLFAAHLAHAVAQGAWLRAQPLMTQLPPDQLPDNFAREFARHVRAARERIAQLG
jgi:glutamate formiminotransferase